MSWRTGLLFNDARLQPTLQRPFGWRILVPEKCRRSCTHRRHPMMSRTLQMAR